MWGEGAENNTVEAVDALPKSTGGDLCHVASLFPKKTVLCFYPQAETVPLRPFLVKNGIVLFYVNLSPLLFGNRIEI